jgi:hypothetical protein
MENNIAVHTHKIQSLEEEIQEMHMLREVQKLKKEREKLLWNTSTNPDSKKRPKTAK